MNDWISTDKQLTLFKDQPEFQFYNWDHTFKSEISVIENI